MKYLLAWLLILLSLTTYSQWQSPITPNILQNVPPSQIDISQAGMSEERIKLIDDMLSEAVENKEVPGIVALVARHGRIVFYNAYGMANNELNKRMREDAIFRIASQSKAITSTAVMVLWEQGKFNLDDPISKYIPEFKNPVILSDFNENDTSYTTQACENEITIRQLLTHTAGVGYGQIDGDPRFKMIYKKAGITDLFTTQDVTIGESVKKLAKLPLHFEPGTDYSYSEGLDVLGYFVEIISGQPFDEFLREHIFDPIGMDDTWFYLPSRNANRLVTVQMLENGKWVPYPITFYDPDYPIKGARKFFSGGAGLSSTALDYAKFLQMYLNGGTYNGHRILSRTTIQSMMGNQTGDKFNDPGRYYGLAFGVMNQTGQNQGGRGSKGTFDWGGYFNTQYFADPEEGIIGILMKQTQGPVSDGTSGKFRRMVFAAVND